MIVFITLHLNGDAFILNVDHIVSIFTDGLNRSNIMTDGTPCDGVQPYYVADETIEEIAALMREAIGIENEQV